MELLAPENNNASSRATVTEKYDTASADKDAPLSTVDVGNAKNKNMEEDQQADH